MEENIKKHFGTSSEIQTYVLSVQTTPNTDFFFFFLNANPYLVCEDNRINTYANFAYRKK